MSGLASVLLEQVRTTVCDGDDQQRTTLGNVLLLQIIHQRARLDDEYIWVLPASLAQNCF